MSRKLRRRVLPRAQALEGAEPYYPRELPALRRDAGYYRLRFRQVEHRIDLYRTGAHRLLPWVADGVEWKRRVGWSKVLAAFA